MRRVPTVIVPFVMLSACAVVTQPSFPVATPAPRAQEQQASGKYGPEPGESLLQFGGSLTSQNRVPGTDDTSLALQGGIGWFQSDWLEIGGQVLSDWSSGAGPDSILLSVSPYVNANYKLPQNPRVWLYAGPHLGLAYINFSSDDAVTIEYGLHGGSRYWLDPRTSVFGELRYTHSSFDIASINIDSDTFQLLFGFTVVF